MKIDQAVKGELATPKDWGFAKTTKKGTDYFWMEFVFPELEASDGTGEVTIQKIWYLTDATIEYVLRDLAVLGWHGDNIYECQRIPEGHDFSGVKCRISTKWDTPWQDDKGKMHDKMIVEYINPVDFVPLKALDEKDVKAMSSKFRGKIAAFRKREGITPVARAGKGPIFQEPVMAGSSKPASERTLASKEAFSKATDEYLDGK